MSFFGEIYADPDLPHRARTVYMYLRDRARRWELLAGCENHSP